MTGRGIQVLGDRFKGAGLPVQLRVTLVNRMLSLPLRQAILSRAGVRRLGDGAPLASRGAAAEEWCGVALGAVRVSSVSLSGKQVTLTYVEPGTWFGDIALFDGLPRTHDADAHGATTLLVVRKADFKELLSQHVELYDALLRLNCRRLRLMFDQFEDLNTKPLRSRLARQRSAAQSGFAGPSPGRSSNVRYGSMTATIRSLRRAVHLDFRRDGP